MSNTDKEAPNEARDWAGNRSCVCTERQGCAVIVVVVFDTCMSVGNGAYEPEPKYLRRWGVRANAVSSWMGMGILRLVDVGRLMGRSAWAACLSGPRVASNHGYCRPLHLLKFDIQYSNHPSKIIP
jgi:hypothetical protein